MLLRAKLFSDLLVWSWSLRGHRSSWQLGNMNRTTVSMVETTFAKHLNLIIVIFLVKVSQVHEVWSWSLRGHKPSWQLGNMFRTTVSMVGTTLAKHLYLIIVIFHVKMPTVLEVWSLSLRGQDAMPPVHEVWSWTRAWKFTKWKLWAAILGHLWTLGH